VGGVRKASLDELRALPWLPDAVGTAVHERLHRGEVSVHEA
jgi:hypothetical protein